MDRKSPIRSPLGARRRFLPRAFAAAATLAFLLAAAWILRLAWADLEFRRGTPAASQRAVTLAPGHARYWKARSDWGSPEREVDLERAVRLNPYDAEAWIELGLMAEARGDLARAERCLEQAARVDKGFRPRWTLANYYFRRRQADKFWQWAHLSLLVAPGDTPALYRLCWLLEPNEELILSRAIPNQPDQLARYLLFLLHDKRPEAAVRVAHRLIEHRAAEHTGLVVGLTEQLLTQGKVEPSLELWNALCRHGLLPYEALDLHRGRLVTNAHFRTPPRGAGFDWRILPVEGVSAALVPAGGGLRIRFSGRQPERCELLAQYLPVLPGRCYTLRWRHRTADPGGPSGLRWQISEAGSRRKIAAAPLGWDQGNETTAVDFCVAPAAKLIKLTLRYDRLVGTTPIQGSLLVEAVELSEAPARYPNARPARRYAPRPAPAPAGAGAAAPASAARAAP